MANGYASSLIASLRGNTPASSAPVMGSGPTAGVGPQALSYPWMQNPNTTPIAFTPPERVRLNRPERIQSQGLTQREMAEERMREVLNTSFNPLNGLPPHMQEAMERMAEEFGGNQFDQYVNAPTTPVSNAAPVSQPVYRGTREVEPFAEPQPVTRTVNDVTPEDFAALVDVSRTIDVPANVEPIAPVDMYEPGFDLNSLDFAEIDIPQMQALTPIEEPVARPVQPSPILPVSSLMPLQEELFIPVLPETPEEIQAAYVPNREVTPEEIQRQLMMNPAYFNLF